jgi:hypothetical protein
MRKILLVVMGFVETVTGLGLLASPPLIASVLLGASLEDAVGLVVARICGAALLSLGIACFLARDDANVKAATGLIIAMVVYNTIATAVLAYCVFGLGLTGIALWPAIVVHAALAIWCLAALSLQSRVGP